MSDIFFISVEGTCILVNLIGIWVFRDFGILVN